MKVAGFSVGGVMVSTTDSDPVDRGSTPFLPTLIFFVCMRIDFFTAAGL